MKLIYCLFAFLFLGIGVIGVVLPVLPTVPFLMLASMFFAKGSDRFDRWFKETKIYREHFESFEKDRSMTLKTKARILAFASTMLLLVFFRFDHLPMRIAIAGLIVFKYYYFFFHIKTISE